MARSRVEKSASELLAAAGPVTVPVDVERLAALAGAQLIWQRLDRTVSGLLLRVDDSAVLAVNESHHPRRQRFTIAHELGHLRLHPGRRETVDSTVRVNRRDNLSSTATNGQEIEANAFAAALLMPEDAVREAVTKLRSSTAANANRVVEVLAAEFDVSADAMGYRLINLGLST